MPPPDQNTALLVSKQSGFKTTLWTVVLHAGDSGSLHSQAALEKLCRLYWYPLYSFVRRQGYDSHQAQDLTQEFFCRMIEKNYFQEADRNRGRFRSFILTSLKHFLANEWDRSQRQKRGGGVTIISIQAEEAEERFSHEPADGRTPETIYDQRWAQALLQQVMARLRDEFTEGGKTERFGELKNFLLDDDVASYAEVATRLEMTESAVKSALHRMRQRYGELFREEISNTVATPGEVDEEIRQLFVALRN